MMKKTILCILALLLVCAPLSASANTCGDADGNGIVNAVDYMMIRWYVLGAYQLTGDSKTAADANCDGEIGLQDFMLIKSHILGLVDLEEPTDTEKTPDVSYEESSGTESSETAEPTVAEQILALVNEERAKNGLAALTLSKELTRVAVIKAEDMANSGYFSHTSPTYGTPFEMMSDFGISYRSAGENIAAGQQTAEEVMESWMNSEGHRANILNASFTTLGVGIAFGGEYGTYWVQMFIG